MAEIQSGESQKERLTVDEFIPVNELPLEEEDKELITTLINEYKATKEDLNTARIKWREEFDKRKAVEKVLKELGQGTGFLDVEKLRKDINTVELEIFNSREDIRVRTESMQEAKARDQVNMQTEKEGLRTLKKSCESEFKRRKKELDGKLKKVRHELTINEEERKLSGLTKEDWKKEVLIRTKAKEDEFNKELKDLQEKQQRNIQKQEEKIQTLQEDFDKKYGACEEEIRKLRTSVEKMTIKSSDLKMARINRIAYINALETREYLPDEATAK